MMELFQEVAKFIGTGSKALPQQIALGKFNFEWAQISTKQTGAPGVGW